MPAGSLANFSSRTDVITSRSSRADSGGSSIRNSGSIPAVKAFSRNNLVQNPSIVWIRTLSNFLLSSSETPSARASREYIWCVALTVNVIAKIRSGATSRTSINRLMRSTSTRVFPDPGPAVTTTSPACQLATASSCLGVSSIIGNQAEAASACSGEVQPMRQTVLKLQ